ncbi:DNA internalization-related competence protein ComEC/Rec2 [Spongiibacter sp. KMU-158]|uniref:DNA internalization-related competence protein ComEC/Rec2 n=1 Tax=Spongiibacter pelagi TaxID=2760804 RepID=A0A927GW44_9GAMM|nr:DNA internalization-related competence protein ComEC/Rec2 [Spongiibacter pelagi]MBD2859070.1 DNA internalization-related competence protein ComEC/Rec2 [Spongiibacter pelagi]
MTAFALAMCLTAYLPVLLPASWPLSAAAAVVLPCLFCKYGLCKYGFCKYGFCRENVRLSGSYYLSFICACLGAAYFSANAQQRLEQVWPESLAGQDVNAEVEIVSLPEALSGGRRGPQFRFDARLLEGQCFALPGTPESLFCPPGEPRLRLNSYLPQNFKPGGRYQLRLRLWPPDGRHSPGAFNYQRWLWASAYSATAYVPEFYTYLGQSTHARAKFMAWRQSLLTELQPLFELRSQEALIKALLFADRSGMSSQHWRVFSRTGTSHLMAISGMHLGMVFGWILLLARGLQLFSRGGSRWRWGSVLLAWLTTLVYAGMANFTLPTQRALIMLAVLTLGLASARFVPPWRGLSLALLLVLLLDPLASHSAGFILSFSAVAVLLLVFSSYRGRTQTSVFSHLLKAQLVLGVGLLPVSLAMNFWHSSVALPANMIAIPLMTFLILPLLLLSVLLFLILPSAGLVLMSGANWVLQGLMEILHAFSEFAPNWQPANGAWVIIGLLLVAFILLLPRGMPGRWLMPPLLLLLLFWPSREIKKERFEVTVLDVGQGLSVLVKTQYHALLYDVGPDFDSGFNSFDGIIWPYLRKAGVDDLDAVVLSHGDRDHAGSLSALLAQLPVAQIVSGEPLRIRSQLAEALPLVFTEVQNCHSVNQPISWTWDDVEFQFMSVAAQLSLTFENKGPKVKSNNRSCVLKISSSNGTALITGDIEKGVEEPLLAKFGSNLQSGLLIAPHHGSLTSSSEKFIAGVNPQLAVFSAARFNRYRHPRREVQARYCARGVQLASTGLQGSLRFESGPGGWRVADQGRRKKYFWQRQPEEMCVISQKGD